ASFLTPAVLPLFMFTKGTRMNHEYLIRAIVYKDSLKPEDNSRPRPAPRRDICPSLHNVEMA
ncbi:MAG TPA: hypothetical protein VHM90_06540, partial [Phycisphaerae bacterium]|nr:hypothetical protein [Phycisphaerae bacterium]